jgi:hypothetical protein
LKKKNVNPDKVFVQDPLEVIPLVPDNVEKKNDENGTLQIRIKVPLKSWQKKIVDFLKYDYSKVVALDKMGSAFYERVDGTRSLRQIAKELAALFNTSLAEMEKSVTNFTKILMERSMLVLKLEKKNKI